MPGRQTVPTPATSISTPSKFPQWPYAAKINIDMAFYKFSPPGVGTEDTNMFSSLANKRFTNNNDCYWSDAPNHKEHRLMPKIINLNWGMRVRN